VLEVPYANSLGSQTRGASDDDEGGLAALTRVRETWEAQWTPATDMALVEKIVLGDTLHDVTTRVLGESLATARTTGAAAEVLLEAVVCDVPRVVAEALAVCESFAASDDDLPSLSRACRALSGVVTFGSSRSVGGVSDASLRALCEKIYARAVMRTPGACLVNDDATSSVKEAMRVLHEVALGSTLVDETPWRATLRGLADSTSAHPTCAGLAAGLAWLAGEFVDDDIARLVSYRLSSAIEPLAGASFLEGFLEVNAMALVRSRAVVNALDTFLQGIASDRFTHALPVLRRAFATLGKSERRYLLENVLGLRNLGDKAAEARVLTDSRDVEAVKAKLSDVDNLMDDLDHLL
jgi:hypothetical protein